MIHHREIRYLNQIKGMDDDRLRLVAVLTECLFRNANDAELLILSHAYLPDMGPVVIVNAEGLVLYMNREAERVNKLPFRRAYLKKYPVESLGDTRPVLTVAGRLLGHVLPAEPA